MRKSTKIMQLVFRSFMLLVLVVLVACEGESSASDDTNESNDEEVYTLQMTSTFTPPADDSVRDGKNLGTKFFAEEIEKRTDGRVKVETFFSNQLVPQEQTLDAVRNGTVDMANASAYWGDILPTQDFIWMPFAFQNPDHYLHVMRETEAGELFEKEMEEYGVKLLMHWSSGYQGLISSVPIESVDDMEGLTVRIPSGVYDSWYREMGAAPANVAAAEQYEALDRGIIDATVFPFYTIDLYNFYEVAKHTTTPALISPMMAMNFISLEKWNELPEDIQQIITEVSLELEAEGMEYVKTVFENSMEFAKENGVTVHELSEKELNRFIESAQVVYDEFGSRSDETARMMEALFESQEDFK